MKLTSLKTSIWIVNTILILLAVVMFFLFGFSYFWAYGFNESFRISFWDISEEIKNIPGNMRMFLMVFMILQNAVLMYIFYKVRTALLKIHNDGPFEVGVLHIMKRVSRWFILFIILKVMYLFLKGILVKGQFTLQIDMSTFYTLFLISMIYVMIEVFTYGAKIIEEQKLTV